MESFESAKSEIVGSALGSALSMSTSSTWSDVVTKIKGVKIGTRSVTQSNTKDYWTASGANLTYITRIDVDATSVYNNGYNAGVKSTSGTASTSDILTGKTAWVNGTKITGTMKNYTSITQTATTSTNDTTKTCYQVNSGYISVVPAIGYWGSWDFTKSIRVPTSSVLKHTYLSLTSSSSRYNFKYYNSSGNATEEAWYYIEYNWNIIHQIVSAFIYIEGVAGGYEYYLLSADGRCCQLGDNHWVALNLTHPSWNTATYFPYPVNKSNTTYKVSMWYV